MGQAASRAPPAPLDLDPNPNSLPDELLALILSWVPGPVLVTRCRLVCRRWAGPPRRAHGVAAAGREAAGLAGHPGGRPPLPPAAVEPDLPAGALGADQFCHWHVEHGGNGWMVEENRCPVEDAPAQTCFVSSFQWCIKSQLVDLLKQGLWEELLDNYQPEIYISDWWGAREDCGCEYSICVKLLAADGRTVIAEFQANPDPIQQWNDARYHHVSYWFRQYGRGVRYVHFLHKGKDTHFWAGHYGARITNSTVMVKLG
ncbi:unnamed protein product [Lepidochelys kempii]